MIARLRRLRTQDHERGSAVLEGVILAVPVLMVVGLIIAGGRIELAKQRIEAAAADAARSASIARTQPEAISAATGSADASLANRGLDCSWRDVSADTSGFASPAGTSASVSVTVSCTVPLADIAIPGLPGQRTITKTMTSPIDTYRER